MSRKAAFSLAGPAPFFMQQPSLPICVTLEYRLGQLRLGCRWRALVVWCLQPSSHRLEWTWLMCLTLP